MSHHFDSPTAIEDGRLNLCDVYAFPSRPGTTSLILTVNPDAGRSSPTTFRSEAVYEFVVGPDRTAGRTLSLLVRFSDPSDGSQEFRVLTASGTGTAEPRREIEVAAKAHAFGNVRKQVVDRLDADRVEHLTTVVRCV